MPAALDRQEPEARRWRGALNLYKCTVRMSGGAQRKPEVFVFPPSACYSRTTRAAYDQKDRRGFHPAQMRRLRTLGMRRKNSTVSAPHSAARSWLAGRAGHSNAEFNGQDRADDRFVLIAAGLLGSLYLFGRHLHPRRISCGSVPDRSARRIAWWQYGFAPIALLGAIIFVRLRPPALTAASASAWWVWKKGRRADDRPPQA